MLDLLPSGRNAFQETMLGLEYTARPDVPADLFSRACVEQYQEMDLSCFSYVFAQVFEPEVLIEVAVLADVPYEDVADLTYQPTPAITRLAELTRGRADLPVMALVNLAAALISISRFDVAAQVLEDAAARVANPRELFETAMLEFAVANRRNDGKDSPQAFARMREAVEAGTIPRERILDACTQAVVWYLKRRELPEAEFTWYLKTGLSLAKAAGHVDSGAISSWYRAVAMIPAAKGDATGTRRLMGYARDAASETLARRPRAYEMHLMKTYYESTLKEHMYVTRDFDQAEEAGKALIDLDPQWAPSYAELAEVYHKFGKVEQAASFYEMAVACGPPYVGFHLLQAARCRETLGDSERAVAYYLALSRLAPESEPVLSAGLDNARRISHPASGHFAESLARIASGTPSDRPVREEGR